MVGDLQDSIRQSKLTPYFFFAVVCKVNARKITISGKRGEVKKDFSHVACELKALKQSEKKRNGNFIRIRIWFGGYKQACAVNTLKSLITNMITGVTEVSPSFAAQSRQLRRAFCCACFLFLLVFINNYTNECLHHYRASATR